MTLIIVIFAVLIAAVGWHYAFHSVAGARLAAIERTADNRRRVQMRRFGGIILLFMGILFYAGIKAVTAERNPQWFVIIWAVILTLLLLLIVLALLDLRLTHRLRQRHMQKDRR